MLTAALRDLHLCFPGEFLTDVRTSAMPLWLNNPHITPIADDDSTAELLDCHYPLIRSSNTNGRHFLTAFHHFIGSYLMKDYGLQEFKGDIHLATNEVESAPLRLLGTHYRATDRYWIVAAGGKFDFTAKWWPTAHYQTVVRELLGHIQFVQVGAMRDYHPPLQHVIDLRGKTSLRELIHLVYWSSGVLSPVTFLMHLAAAVPMNPAIRVGLRPCVVLAGGREPVSWEAYPGHQYLHTIGMLECCAFGACWRSRVRQLHDGSPQDNSICSLPIAGYAGCMDSIKPSIVIQSILQYDGLKKPSGSPSG